MQAIEYPKCLDAHPQQKGQRSERRKRRALAVETASPLNTLTVYLPAEGAANRLWEWRADPLLRPDERFLSSHEERLEGERREPTVALLPVFRSLSLSLLCSAFFPRATGLCLRGLLLWILLNLPVLV